MEQYTFRCADGHVTTSPASWAGAPIDSWTPCGVMRNDGGRCVLTATFDGANAELLSRASDMRVFRALQHEIEWMIRAALPALGITDGRTDGALWFATDARGARVERSAGSQHVLLVYQGPGDHAKLVRRVPILGAEAKSIADVIVRMLTENDIS